MSQVYIHRWAHWGRPDSRSSEAVPWCKDQTLSDLLRADLSGRAGIVIHVNGCMLPAGEEVVRFVQPGDHVDVASPPGGPLPLGLTLLISAAISVAVSFVIQLLLPKPDGPSERGDERSPTYAWSGKDNVRIEGQPRALIYGEMRVAPQVLDEFTRNQVAPPQSDLYMLLGFGEGPIDSIGGVTADNDPATPLTQSDTAHPLPKDIELNSNPAENLGGIEAHVRLGTNEQLGVPGFEEVHTVSAIGSTLEQALTVSSDNSAGSWSFATYPYNSNSAPPQAVWDQYARTFDLPGGADAYTIRVKFQEGLYGIDANGNLTDQYFQPLVRYRELDGAGDPITTGGDNGDGWLYVPPVPRLAARQQSQFFYETGGLFYSPAGWVPPTLGRTLDANASGGYAYTATSAGSAAANLQSPWLAGNNISELTFETWFRPDNTNYIAEDRPIFEWLSSTPFKGVAFRIIRLFYDGGEAGPIATWRFEVSLGNNTGTLLRQIDTYLGDLDYLAFPSQWEHLAISWKRAVSGSYGRLRFYVNGNMIAEHLLATEMVAPAAPFYLARQINAGSAYSGRARMDETRLWSRELSAVEIQGSYGGGNGNFAAPAATGLVSAWHYDLNEVITAYTYSASAGPFTNNLSRGGSAVIGDPASPSGVVSRPPVGTLTNARYRVQLLRHNLKSSSTLIRDQADWDSIDAREDLALAYPHTPSLALKVTAADQLNANAPKVTAVVGGLLVPVWDGIDPDQPSYVRQWSANPAWILADIFTNRRYGAGRHFSLDSGLDLPSFQEFADYCDGLIYDGLGRTGVHESDTTKPILNLQYDSTMFGGFGGIHVFFRVGQTPPAHWTVGYWLAFSGIPFPTAGLDVDINAPNVEGLEVGAVYLSGNWIVDLKWDRVAYGDPWLDGSFLPDRITPAMAGLLEGREERFRWDGVLDTFTRQWDVVLQICGTARATPILDGGRIRIKVARPRLPVALVGHASIEPGSLKIGYVGSQQRVYVADILDRDQNWERRPIKIPDDPLALTSAGATPENITLQGITRRSQALRELRFRRNVEATLTRQGEFRTGLEGIFYEPGDVIILAPDLVPWGKSGRLNAAPSGTSLTIDRAVTLASGKTYYVTVRMNAQGQVGSGSSVADYMETREITSGAGTYAAGTTLTMASAFNAAPAKDDPYVLFSEDERFLVEITETVLTPDYKRLVRWVQYNDSVYDVDTLPQDLPDESNLLANGSGWSGVVPAPVVQLSVTENARRTGGGPWVPEINVAWTLEDSTARVVCDVVVWARLSGGEGQWEEVARATGPATSAAFRPRWDLPGVVVDVAVQARNGRGARLPADRCTRASVLLRGRAVNPPAPTNLQATLDGEQVTYRWTPPANSRGLSFELRRGGWALGQVVGIGPPGSTSLGPTRNWSAGKINVRGDLQAPIYLRARDERGRYSSAAVLVGFNPVVPGSKVLAPPNVLGKRINGDQCWEDYGSGWSGGSPAPILTDVEVFTRATGAKALRFAGSATTGSYQTVVGTIDADSKPERAYVEAYAVATQVPPLTVADIGLGLDDPRSAGRSIEGIVGASACTLSIEWRFKLQPSDSYGDWQRFEPGVYYFVAPQFRLVLTRPDATWQVWVERFGTRMSRVPPTKFVKSQVAQHFPLEPSAIG